MSALSRKWLVWRETDTQTARHARILRARDPKIPAADKLLTFVVTSILRALEDCVVDRASYGEGAYYWGSMYNSATPGASTTPLHRGLHQGKSGPAYNYVAVKTTTAKNYYSMI